MALCGDIEVHKLQDLDEEYFFMLDMARVFPPAFPASTEPLGAILFRMLRPELVLKLKKKLSRGLSSDSLSLWQNGDPDKLQMDQDIAKATQFLEEEVCLYAKELCNEKLNAKIIDTAIAKMKHPTWDGIAIKNIWRENIRQANDQIIREVCLQETENILNKIILLDVKKGVDQDTNQAFWKDINLRIVKMFEKGILYSVADQLALKNIIEASSKSIYLSWIIIRFCQMCGIKISPDSIHCINEGYTFHFSRIDITEFVVNIKYPPVLDYYIGLFHLEKAKGTDTIGNKLSLMKNAMERFSNALNYDFPDVKKFYAISLFEAIKLDRNTIGDWDIVLEEYRKIWEISKSEENDEFLELVCATLWRIFLQPITEKDLNITTVVLNIDKNLFSRAFFQCLNMNQRSMTIGLLEKIRKRFVLMNQRRSRFLVDSKLNVKKLKLSRKTMLKLIEESKSWDIDLEKKWWFFSEYFSMHELRQFCKNNNILNPQDTREKKFLLSPSPELCCIFHEGSPEILSILKELKVEDEDMTAILKMTNEKEETILHCLHDDYAPEILKILLDKGFSLDDRAAKGETPLHCAVTNMHIEVVKLLISQQSDINAPDDRGYTPLHCAVDIGNLAITNILIKAGCNLEAQDQWQGTPLHIALKKGTKKVVEINMESVVSAESIGSNYLLSPREDKPDGEEKEKSIEPIVKALCDANANVNAVDNKGLTPLHYATSLGYRNVVQFLLTVPQSDINAKDHNGYTPLHHAAIQGLHLMVSDLLKAGCDKNARDNRRRTAIIIAVRMGAIDTLKTLLKEKCNAERRDEEGLSALHIAAYQGQVDIVKQLINHKCNINIKNKNQGRTPLHSAVAAGKDKVIKALFLGGCNKEAQDYNGSTPLHTAVRAGRSAIITLLLGYECNKEAIDKMGRTPFHRSVEIGKQQLVTFLLSKDCNKDTQSQDGSTPLHTAVKSSNVEMVRLLVASGCNKEVVDKNGSIPLDYATVDEIKDILKEQKK